MIRMGAPPRRATGRLYRGASLENRQSERRHKLVAAGMKVMGTVGFHDATVRAICTQAGLTERYFYESFDSLEELLCAVYQAIIDELRGITQQAIANAPPL